MTKSIYEHFATDAKLETEGRWYRVGDQEFLLARAGGANTKFTAAYAAASRPYERQQRLGTLAEATAREMLVVPFAKHVLKDWRTRISADKTEDHVITDEAGQPMKFSEQNARKLLTDLTDLLMTLADAAGAYTNYAPEDMEDDAKNL